MGGLHSLSTLTRARVIRVKRNAPPNTSQPQTPFSSPAALLWSMLSFMRPARRRPSSTSRFRASSRFLPSVLIEAVLRVIAVVPRRFQAHALEAGALGAGLGLVLDVVVEFEPGAEGLGVTDELP
jgi:hypothetical protein